MARWVGWWMVVVALGCGSKASDDGVSETSDDTMAETSDDTTAQTSDDGVAETSDDTMAETSGGAESSGTTGPSLSHDDVEAMCAIAATRADCEAVPMAGDGTDFSWCVWEIWTAASIDERGMCTLGAVEESCGYQRGGDTCAGYSSSSCGQTGGYAGAWDGTRVGLSEEWCNAPGESCSVHDGVVGEGPPECACLCGANWPEAP